MSSYARGLLRQQTLRKSKVDLPVTRAGTRTMNDMLMISKQLRRVALVFALASLTMCAVVSPASAADIAATGTPAGYGYGYKNVLNGKDAFQRIFTVGNSKIPVYSTSYTGSVPNDPSIAFQSVTRSKSGLNNIAKAADVAARSSSIRTSLEDANSEAVAVQLAIWKLLEGTDIKPVGTINAPIMQRADELVENASSSNTPERASEVTVRLSAEKFDEGYRVSVTLSTAGRALAGEYVTVKAGSRTLRVLTNSAGVALAKLPKLSKTTTITGSFTWSLPAGTIMVPPSGASVITAKSAYITSSDSTKISIRSSSPAVAATPRATPSVTKDPSAEPTPSPTPSPSESEVEEFVDPAAEVIDLTPEQQAEVTGKGSVRGLLPLVGVIILFLLALLIARNRINDR
jgi:hypothetical protein